MNIYDQLIFSLIIILFPLLCYLFYIVTNNNINDNTKDIGLHFTLCTIIYFIFKFIKGANINFAMLLLFIPMYICLDRKYNILSIIICFIFLLFNYNVLFILYPLLAIIFNKLLNKKNNIDIYFISTIIINLPIIYGTNIVLYVSLYYLILKFSIYTINKGEQVINYYVEYNDLKHEKEIRLSLFKITHEIKNPLAVCKAYIDMFDYNNPDCAKRYVPIISGEIDKLLILLQDFLLVNKDNINCDIMDINMMLEDVTDSLKELEDYNINLKIDEDDEILINGDYNRLTQVVTNLIKNSFEAGADKVDIESNIVEDKLELKVIDNGTGMDMNNIENIFTPFYTTKIDGTGLGVPLSKEIIEAHNGNLSYKNNKKKGVCAKVVIPLLDF